MARALRIVLSLAAPLPRQALDSSTGSPWACLTSSMILLFCLLVYTAASSDCFVHAPVLQLQPRSFLALVLGVTTLLRQRNRSADPCPPPPLAPRAQEGTSLWSAAP